MTPQRKRRWARLWRKIMERTGMSEPAAKHAALIAIDYLLPEKD